MQIKLQMILDVKNQDLHIQLQHDLMTERMQRWMAGNEDEDNNKMGGHGMVYHVVIVFISQHDHTAPWRCICISIFVPHICQKFE